jgi:hypothetical protein
MNIAIYYTQIRLNQGRLIAIIAILLLLVTHVAIAFEHDKTPENVHKKALIIKHDAILFNGVTGNHGDSAPFMQIYFMMKPAMGRRVPVSKSPYKKHSPDGWLEKGSFLEWNTLQMIKPEAQGGRKLAMIFESQQCAEKFGRSGTKPAYCQVLGEEPTRSNAKTNKNKQQLLIPVFKKGRNSYHGGFIRVYQRGSTIIAPSPKLYNKAQSPQPQGGQIVMGYDIVFVIDSTKSMGKYFIPTTEVLQSFIKHVQKHARVGKEKIPLRMGLLFYRDRLLDKENCAIEFITRWGKHLTSHIEGVIRALKGAEETNCDSEEEAEAVLDALNRVLDVQWQDNSFKIIILVGDAPPHPLDSKNKNPMKLSVPFIIKEADKKQVRFLTFKLGNDDKAFKTLALGAKPDNRGRYQYIPIHSDFEAFKTHLLTAMRKEWDIVRKAIKVIKRGGASALDKPDIRKAFDIKDYEALIIKARLPPSHNSQGFPEFVTGWIPQQIQNRLAVDEFIFMDKGRLTILTNNLSLIARAAKRGNQNNGGYDAFLKTVKNVFASITKVPALKLFQSGESLDRILQRINILPFKTDILAFTATEVQTWKPKKYQELYTILEEKVKTLREFMNNPNQTYIMVGGRHHVYVPRRFFP